MSSSDCRELVVARLSKLHQMLEGRGLSCSDYKNLFCPDGLLDALIVLFDECSKDSVSSRSRHAKAFVEKYTPLIKDLRRLRVSIDDFDSKGIVGRGQFGEVHVVHERGTKNVYALKILRKDDMQQNVSFYEEERDIMARANSPWLTQLQYAFQDQTNLYLVMDFHPGGDLLSLLHRKHSDEYDVFEEGMAMFYLAEMVLAVHSLHSMGYVHRDVKPENILIDRTGHIKLVDFGSACRLHSNSARASNMPVGTPDYVCPEALMRPQSSEEQNYFGEECDWWSLGVCAYEMLYGQFPFSDRDSGSMVVTFANIMNYKDFLTFPNGKVSRSAEDLIRSLLTDQESRLSYESIRSHPFFADVDFDNIHKTRPPFIPTIRTNDDMSNFEDFENVTKTVKFSASPLTRQFGFNGKDLPFIGFTFSKLFMSSGSGWRSAETQSFSSPHDTPQNTVELERQVSLLKMENERSKKQLTDCEERLKTGDETRVVLEGNISAYVAEINNLKRSLDLEKKRSKAMDEKATRILDDINSSSHQTQKCMRDEFSKRIHEQREIVDKLEAENRDLLNKVSLLENQLKKGSTKPPSARHGSSNGSVEELRIQITHECKDVYRSKIKDLCARLKKQQQDFASQELELKAQNEKVLTQLFEYRQSMERSNAEKLSLQAEVKKLVDECANAVSARKAIEEQCKTLESRTVRLNLLEDRDRHLTRQLDDKNSCIVALQLKTSELDAEIFRLKLEKADVLNQSVLALEENEARLQNIREQEAVISKLKSNLATLETQVSSLKSDLTEVRRVHGKGYRGTTREIPDLLEPNSKIESAEPRDGFSRTSPIPRVSFSYVYQRNKGRDWVPTIASSNSNDLEQEVDNNGDALHLKTVEVEPDMERNGDERKKHSVFISPENPCCAGSFAHRTSGKRSSTFFIKTGRSRTGGFSCQADYCNSSGSFTSSSMSDSTITRLSGDDVTQLEDSTSDAKKRTAIETPRSSSGELYSLDDSFNHLVETNSDTSCPAFDLKIRARVKTKKHCGRDHVESEHKKRGQTVQVQNVLGSSMPRSSKSSLAATVGCVSVSTDLSKADDRLCASSAVKLCDVAVGSELKYQDVGSSMTQLLHNASTGMSGSLGGVKCPSCCDVTEALKIANSDLRKQLADCELQLRQLERQLTDQQLERTGSEVKREDEMVEGVERNENARLLNLIDSLQNEIAHFKDVAHEQRIRALDLKHELREKTASLSNEVTELTFQLSKSELELNEARQGLMKAQEKECELRQLLEKLECEKEVACQEAKQADIATKNFQQELEGQVERLRIQVETVEKTELEIRQLKNQYKTELDEAKKKWQEYESQCEELSMRLKTLMGEKMQLELNSEKNKIELEETKRHSDCLEKQAEELKALCRELESQAQDLEKLVEHKDAKLNRLTLQYESTQQKTDNAKTSELAKLQKEVAEGKSLNVQQKMLADAANAEVEHKLSTLESENKSLKRQLEGSEGTKKQVLTEVENELHAAVEERSRLSQELSTVRRELSDSRKQVDKFKSLCKELESQVTDLDLICSTHEAAKSKLESNETTFKKTVEALEHDVKRLQNQLSIEKQSRTAGEEQQSDSVRRVESTNSSLVIEIDRIRVQLAEQYAYTESLNGQLTKAEERRLQLEQENTNLQRRLASAEQDIFSLKEEISKEITRSQELKASNFALNKKLETDVTRLDTLSTDKKSLESQIEALQENYRYEKYRMEETNSQQAKLIVFLQDKVESTPRKKKWFIGGKATHTAETGSNMVQVSNVHVREGYSTLQRERDKTRPLTLHITQPSAPPAASATLPGRPKSEISMDRHGNGAHSSSAANRLSSHVAGSVPSIGAKPVTNDKRHQGEKHKHSSSHKFHTGINSRATKCIVCLGSIHYVQQAARCQDCNAICHPRCIPNLPANCGLPSDYSRYMIDAMAYIRPPKYSSNSGKTVVPSAPAVHLQLSGFLKVPRSGKSTWETKFIVLHGNKLFVYNDSEELTSGIKAIEEFDLCPSNGVVSIQSAVSQTELVNVAVNDLPFILMIEFEPDDVSYPNRTQYLMAKSYVDKQKWAATLEAIASSNQNTSKIKDIKVFGNVICRTSANDDNELDVLCSWPVSSEYLLLGTESGLYAMQFANDVDHRPMIRLPNVECSVHSIEGQHECNMVLFIVGPDRNVIYCELSALKQWLASSNSSPPPDFIAVESTMASTVLAIERNTDGYYLCVAMTESVILYKYNPSLKTFIIRKEVSVSLPCCCLSFNQNGVIFGSDKFYQIDFQKCNVKEFLDSTDSTLAFAVYGASQYDSYPIACISILENQVPTGEYLLCFHEFGVFVNNAGRRCRQANIKWTGLPLMFAYKEPFLYTIHYNAVQVMEIMPQQHQSVSPVGMKTFLNVVGAQYLGPALTSGAIYVASVTEESTDILCLKGNPKSSIEQQH